MTVSIGSRFPGLRRVGALGVSWVLIGAAGCAGVSRSGTAAASDPAPAPLAAAAVGAPLAPPQDPRADELLRDMERNSEVRKAAAAQAARDGKALMNDFRYAEAEKRLEEAVRLDPENEEARRLLSEVRFLLGDRSGEIRDFARSEVEREKVRQQQARVELEHLYTDALSQLNREDFEAAVKTLDLLLERIHWFPYNVDLTDLETRASGKLKEAEQKAQEMRVRSRKQQEQSAQEQARSEKDRTLVGARNRIRELMKKAHESFEDRRYDRTVAICEQVLELDRSHAEARRLQRDSRQLRHLHRTTDVRVQSREEWERAFLNHLESEIPYNKIFNFPSRDRWHELSLKNVSLQARAVVEEDSALKSINLALEEPVNVDFSGQNFEDVLEFLHTVSGINFVLTKAARDSLTDQNNVVRQGPMKDLPLRNVLKLILDERDPKFGYVIQNGAVVIGPSDSIAEEFFLEFYEISDITRDPPDFPAPRLALESEEEGGGGGGATNILVLDDDTEDAGKTSIPSDVLVELVTKTLWGDATPEDESVVYQGGKLVARTTVANHQKIARLLDALRKSTGIMVTVESRFLDLQDNFLEEVGINFGNPFATNLPNPINDIDGVGTQIAPGFEVVDAQGVTDVRGAVFNAFSLPLGSSVAPFELSSRGGFALQYNVLDTYILEAMLEAVAKTQETKRLDAPRVTAFNTQVSHTLVIDQAAYIKDAEVNQTGVVPVINPVIGVLNAGSILQVKPTVSYDRKYVNLEIQPTLATQLPSRFKRLTLGLTSLDVEFPVLSVTQIKTTVTIPDGGTVLVGGLKRTISQESHVGPPFVSHLPGLNLLFGRKGEARMMSTLFVLINAKITIIRDEEAREFN